MRLRKPDAPLRKDEMNMVEKYGCTSGGAQFCQGCYTMEEESDYVDGNWVRAEDYDALAAQLEELRRHLGTLTPGGAHTCITCAAHCVALEDAATELTDLRIKVGFRDNRIRELEAALRRVCLAINDLCDAQEIMPDEIAEALTEAFALVGTASETEAKDE